MSKFDSWIESWNSVAGTSFKATDGSFCKVHTNRKLDVQIEYLSRTDQLVLVAFLGSPTPGKFREELFLQALKSNTLEDPFFFAYIAKSNLLLLQTLFSIDTPIPSFLELLQQLLTKGAPWKQAIEEGNLSLISVRSTSTLASPLEFR